MDQYAEITIGITGNVHGEGFYSPPERTRRWSASNMWLKKALGELAEGGYVIDLRPLADIPEIVSWVIDAPMPNGRIDGEEVDRLPDEVRKSAREMLPFLDAEYKAVAARMAEKSDDTQDGSAGMFDSVSAAYLARYWWTRGARVGRRNGAVIIWADGTQDPIEGVVLLEGAK